MKRRDFIARSFLGGAALLGSQHLLASGAAAEAPAPAEASGNPAWASPAALATAAGRVAGKRPNILFILADDLGWGDLSCYGHPFLKTPRLDQLASEGTLFTHYYCNAAICSPTRAALMTGLFPGRVGMHAQISSRKAMADLQSAEVLDPTHPTLPRTLKEAGYHTTHVGKWHLSLWSQEYPELPRPDAYGFDAYYLPYLSPPPASEPAKWDDVPRGHHTRIFVDECLQQLERRKPDDAPFFMQLWLTDPHEPIDTAPEQMHYYDTVQQHAPYDKAPKLEPHQLYWNMVTDMDAQLGRLFDKLAELKLAEDTLVIFSSDNGAADPLSYDIFVGMGFNGPFRGQKGSLYEGGTRTPFIVRWPGKVAAGAVDNDSVIAGCDMLPTCAALAGAKLPAALEIDGEDRSAALAGAASERQRPLLWQWRFRQAEHPLHRSPMLAIRQGPWKLLLNPDRSRVELYDIPRDPSEVDNQAAQHPDVVEQLATPLLAYHHGLKGNVYDAHAGQVAYNWPKARA